MPFRRVPVGGRGFEPRWLHVPPLLSNHRVTAFLPMLADYATMIS